MSKRQQFSSWALAASLAVIETIIVISISVLCDMLKFSTYSYLTSDYKTSFSIHISVLLYYSHYTFTRGDRINEWTEVQRNYSYIQTLRTRACGSGLICVIIVVFVVGTLKQKYLFIDKGADCFRNSNDSRSAIRIAYRTLLHSSSIWEQDIHRWRFYFKYNYSC